MMRQKRAIQQQALSLWTGNAIYHGIEYVPRTGLNLLRYKRRLRRMAARYTPRRWAAARKRGRRRTAAACTGLPYRRSRT